MNQLERTIYLPSDTFDAIKINSRKVNLAELINPLLAKRKDKYSRIHNEVINLIEDLVTKDLGEMDYYFSKPSSIEKPEMLILPDTQNLYHLSLNCSLLHHQLFNFKVPKEIKLRGYAACKEFKNWFTENFSDEDIDIKKISNEVLKKYGFDWKEGKDTITASCSSCMNYNLDVLDAQILHTIKNFLFIEEINTSKIKTKWKTSGVSWGSENKQNLFRRRLAAYIAIARNPKLKFSGFLMEQLGLNLCPVCKSKDKVLKDRRINE